MLSVTDNETEELSVADKSTEESSVADNSTEESSGAGEVCYGNPCQNGGQCAATYTCRCTDRFTGEHCQTGNIAHQPCP